MAPTYTTPLHRRTDGHPLTAYESTHATLPTILAGNSGGGPVLWAQGTGDADLSADGVVMVGTRASQNLAIDGNEIMARDNGTASTLHLNAEGGQINMGQHDIHPAFAYGVVSSAGTIISSSANVSSVSKSGEGHFDIHFAEPLANTDVVLVTAQGIFFASYQVNSSGVLEADVFDSGGSPTDPIQFSFLVYRP